MKETKFKQTLVQTKEGSRHCEEHSDVAIQGGFKMTEVGLIPSDWEVKLLGEITDVRDGTHDSPKYYDIGYKFVTSKNLINGKIDFSNIQYISKNDFDKINERSKVDINDILFAMIGTIGNPVLITKEPDFAIKNVALFKDKRCTNQVYLKFYLSSVFALNRMLDDAKGSNQKFIPLSYFRAFQIPIPPTIEEQQRIANALSDVDTLIANLEKLIAKKKNIKQGAMQQLLTGKKRLPGFGSDNGHTDWFTPNGVHEKSIKTAKVVRPESIRVKDKEQCAGFKMTEVGMIPSDWEVNRLGDYVSIVRGGSPRPIQDYLTTNSDGINWIKIGDVKPEDKYIVATEEKIISEGKSRSREVHKGDFILSNSMSFGRPYILQIDGCIHDGWLAIQNYQETFDSDFLYYLLGSDEIFKQYIEMAAGSSVQNLNKQKVRNLIIPILDKEEQNFIAKILSDMDNEIDLLNKKLEKYRNLKTAMMQQLLTGKIRLV